MAGEDNKIEVKVKLAKWLNSQEGEKALNARTAVSDLLQQLESGGTYDPKKQVVCIRSTWRQLIFREIETSSLKLALLLIATVPLPIFVLFSWPYVIAAIFKNNWLGFAFYSVTLLGFLSLPLILAVAINRSGSRF